MLELLIFIYLVIKSGELDHLKGKAKKLEKEIYKDREKVKRIEKEIEELTNKIQPKEEPKFYEEIIEIEEDK